MKAWLKILIFLMAFQLEVRVKASSAVLEIPEHCLNNDSACALKIRDPAFHFAKDKSKFHASKDSMLERQSPRNWKLMKGNLWVEKAGGTVFETVFGSAKATHGEYWISTGEDRIYFRNISSDLEVTLRDGRTVQTPAGFQFWISGLNSSAKSEFGMIEPIDMRLLLPTWYLLFQGTKEAFTAKIRDIRQGWGNVVEISSEIYRQQALRRVASAEKQNKNSADKVRKMQLDRERLRSFYHSRVFDR